MVKKLHLMIALGLISGASFSQKHLNEYAPFASSELDNVNAVAPVSNDRALWDIQLDVPPTPIAAGLAGCYWDGTQFWVSKWSNDSIYTANAAGAMTSDFVIAGITGTRSITSDGTRLYIGTAGTNIYQVDPATKTLTSTIPTSVTSCRYLTYDPTLDGGAGGFWTGAYADDIVAVSMTGATLSTIAAGTHTLQGIYGMAYDGYTYGGPYLWAFDQGSSGVATIVQLDITGVPTGITHDTQADLTGATNTGLAGGLFFTNSFGSAAASIGGLSQGVSLFVYERTQPAGIEKTSLENLAIYPNPAQDALNISIGGEKVNAINIYTLEGRLVKNSIGSAKSINVSELTEGVYVIEVQTENGTAIQKFVKK